MKLRACPNCKNTMILIQDQNVQVDSCESCGGLWFDKNELDYIVKKYDPHILNDNFISSLEKEEPSNLKNSRCCPDCNISLKPYNISQYKTLEIDSCMECNGIFLDQGELEQVKVLPRILEIKNITSQPFNPISWLFQIIFPAFPLELNVTPRKIPYVTICVIGINFCTMFLILSASSSEHGHTLDTIYQQWALIPSNFKFYNLFTTMFLHGDFEHLFINMYFLYIFGNNLEEIFGHINYLFFYLLCGLSSGIIHTIFTFHPTILTLGASGAISGLMGAYVVFFRKAKFRVMLFRPFQLKLSALIFCSIYIIIDIIGVLDKNKEIAHFSHLGGFFTGLLMAITIYPLVIKKNPFIKYINKIDS